MNPVRNVLSGDLCSGSSQVAPLQGLYNPTLGLVRLCAFIFIGCLSWTNARMDNKEKSHERRTRGPYQFSLDGHCHCT